MHQLSAALPLHGSFHLTWFTWKSASGYTKIQNRIGAEHFLNLFFKAFKGELKKLLFFFDYL